MEFKFFEMITTPDLDLNQIVKKGIMLKAASAKINNPKETKKNIAKSLNVSERTLQRYASDLNFIDFKKNKTKTHFEPVKCLYCDFIAKNKGGLGAHTRSKHLSELAEISQNQTELTKNASSLSTPFKIQKKPKKASESKNSEKLGMGVTQTLKTDEEYIVEAEAALK
jgi:hypothetical protein